MPSKPHAFSRYSAHGHQPHAVGSVLAFNAQWRDPLTGCYHLGNGYRAYNPALMRFQAADRLSPFGEGGVNAYAYCLGDPVNHRDPTGEKAEDYVLPVLSIFSNLLGIFVSGLRFRSFFKQSRVARSSALDQTAPTIPLPERKDWWLSSISLLSGTAGLTIGVVRTTEPENNWQTWALATLTSISLGTTAFEAWKLAQAKPWRPSNPEMLVPLTPLGLPSTLNAGDIRGG